MVIFAERVYKAIRYRQLTCDVRDRDRLLQLASNYISVYYGAFDTLLGCVWLHSYLNKDVLFLENTTPGSCMYISVTPLPPEVCLACPQLQIVVVIRVAGR